MKQADENEDRGPGRPPIDNPADAHIHLRVTLDRKNAYTRAARPGKLTEWCLRHLDKAADYKPED
jgi:hypothetical protein